MLGDLKYFYDYKFIVFPRNDFNYIFQLGFYLKLLAEPRILLIAQTIVKLKNGFEAEKYLNKSKI